MLCTTRSLQSCNQAAVRVCVFETVLSVRSLKDYKYATHTVSM